MGGWIEKNPIKPGKIITWILTIFMIANVICSGLALIRYDSRSKGRNAEACWEIWMDAHYDDQAIYRIYPNIQSMEKND